MKPVHTSRLKNATYSLLSCLMLLSLLLSACSPSPAAPAAPEVTQPPAASPSETAATPTELPSAIPTAEPTPTPTVDPAIAAREAFIEEAYALLQLFDDGEGMVDSHYIAGMPPGEYDALSDEQKVDIDADAMRDQALAVLSYIRLGKLDDARRLLLAIWDFVSNAQDLGFYIDQSGGTRSMVWWNIACQQYFLLTGDPDVVEFMQWLHWKGYWAFPSGWREEHGRRVTGEVPRFWELEYTVEMITSSLLFLHIMERYDVAQSYGMNDNSFNARDEIQRVQERFTDLARHLHETLYSTGEHVFYPGFTMLEHYTSALQVTCILERSYPDQFDAARIYMYELFKYVEDSFTTTVDENGKTYDSLYRAANEEGIPISFEASLQMALAFKMAAEIHEARLNVPGWVEQYQSMGLEYVFAEPDFIEYYRTEADEIVNSVLAYTADGGFAAVPEASANSLLFNSNGHSGYRAPSLSAVAALIQLKLGSFFDPLLPADKVAEDAPAAASTGVQTLTRQDEDGNIQIFELFRAYPSLDDPELMALRAVLMENNITHIFEVWPETGAVKFLLYLVRDDPAVQAMKLDWAVP